jgi:DNA-directed RNA polymerase specialized sigma24 family protein
MFSPSPSDLVWIISFTPQGKWIAPVVRAAVRLRWREARELAVAQLGDDSLAPELMELAIEQTAEHLAGLSPIDADEASEILLHFYRNAVRRRKRSESQIQFLGTSVDIDVLSASTISFENFVEAEIDLDTILGDTPPEIRLAMLMRLGARRSWKGIAKATSKSVDAIRMSCRRELTRIRRKVGIRDPER